MTHLWLDGRAAQKLLAFIESKRQELTLRTTLRTVILVTALSACTYAEPAGVWVLKLPQVVEQTARPQYPAQAWLKSLTANGAVDIRVDTHGFPVSVTLASWQILGQQADSSQLDQATVAAFQNWRFKPLRVSETLVPFDVRIGFVVRPDGITYTTTIPVPVLSSN